MKKIFLMGDSISGHYYPHLKIFMKGQAEIVCRQDLEAAFQDLAPYCNSRVDFTVLQKLYEDQAFHPDVILLNCGLHDIKVASDGGKYEVELEEYGRNLLTIIRFLKDKCAVVWIRTTSVDEPVHNRQDMPFFRYNADVTHYNEIADKIMTDNGIPELDLYEFTLELEAEYPETRIDHVHYAESIRKLQGVFIAGYLNAYLSLYHNKGEKE